MHPFGGRQLNYVNMSVIYIGAACTPSGDSIKKGSRIGDFTESGTFSHYLFICFYITITFIFPVIPLCPL